MRATSSLIQQATGKLGSVRARRHRHALQFVSSPPPSLSNTIAQQTNRAVFSQAAKQWASALTADDRASWNAYALGHPTTNPIGIPNSNRGVDAWVGCYIVRAEAGLPQLHGVPANANNANATGLTVVATAPNSVAIHDLSAYVFLDIAAACCIIYATSWKSPGVSTPGNSLTNIGVIHSTGSGSHADVAFSTPTTGTAGDLIWIATRVVYPDGSYGRKNVDGPFIAS